jgi:hypothetical protein
MPKPKSQPKRALKKKQKTQPAPESITTKKSYWLMLTLFIVVASSVIFYMMGLELVKIVVLTVTIAAVTGFMGYVRVTSSNFRVVWRAVFIFAGASIIGFCIWAAMVYSLTNAGMMTEIVASIGDQFFGVTSFVICLVAGSFIGELIGKNRAVQEHFADKLKSFS